MRQGDSDSDNHGRAPNLAPDVAPAPPRPASRRGKAGGLRGLIRRARRWFDDPARQDMHRARDRFLQHLHMLIFDHGLLRLVWKNRAAIAPGVWRSNQPGPGRLLRMARRQGLATVLSLRGRERVSFNLLEAEAARQAGLDLQTADLVSRNLPDRDQLLALIDLLPRLRRPLLIHCKSGADRTGFVAALYLYLVENRPLDEAADQLHPRFFHSRRGKTGVLDHFFRVFGRDLAAGGPQLRDWVASVYDPNEIARDYALWLQNGGRA